MPLSTPRGVPEACEGPALWRSESKAPFGGRLQKRVASRRKSGPWLIDALCNPTRSRHRKLSLSHFILLAPVPILSPNPRDPSFSTKFLSLAGGRVSTPAAERKQGNILRCTIYGNGMRSKTHLSRERKGMGVRLCVTQQANALPARRRNMAPTLDGKSGLFVELRERSSGRPTWRSLLGASRGNSQVRSEEGRGLV